MSWITDSDIVWSSYPNISYPGNGNPVGASGWTAGSWGATDSTHYLLISGYGFYAPYYSERSERNQDQRCTVYYDNPAGNQFGNADFGTGVALRWLGPTNPNFYNFQIWNTNQLVICNVKYDPNNVAGGGATTPIASVTAGSNFDPTHTYTLDCQAVGINPTLLSATLRDTTTNTVVAQITNASDSTSALQVSTGVVALYQNQQNSSGTPANDNVYVSRTTTYHAAPGVIPGTLSLGTVASPFVTLDYSGTSGGTSPYVLSVYRDTTEGFTPGSGNRIATSLTDGSFPWTDTSAPLSTDLYYKVGIVDNASQTGTTKGIIVGKRAAKVALLFVGDSITVGIYGPPTPPAAAMSFLSNLRTQKATTTVNIGVSMTTVEDWLSTGSQFSTLNTGISTALAAGAQYCHIMIGTNNAKLGTTESTFIADLITLCTYIVGQGLNVILSYIIYTIPPGLNGSWPESAVALLQQYNTGISGLWNGTTILKGDTLGWPVFGENPSYFQDLTHPNATGNQVLGQLWGEAIDRVLNPGGGGGGGIVTSAARMGSPLSFG